VECESPHENDDDEIGRGVLYYIFIIMYYLLFNFLFFIYYFVLLFLFILFYPLFNFFILFL
jgi:hypothetical protein